MLTLTRITHPSAFSISRNVFSSKPIRRRGFIERFWILILLATFAASTGGYYAYVQALDWWNTEIYLKKQATEVDTSDPVFTKALVNWVKQRSGGQPNTNNEMLTQIVITAFKESSARQLDPLLTLAVIATESRFNYMAASPTGAIGLMQIIPYWHKDKISAVEAYNPATNIKAGTQILREYINLSGGNVSQALLRYNGSLEIPGANYDNKVLQTRADLSKFVENHIRSSYGKTAI